MVEQIDLGVRVGEAFDAEVVKRRIKAVPPGIEDGIPVYQGFIARCDVDLYHSSPIVDLLKTVYGYTGTVFTGLLKQGTKDIVAKWGGYRLKIKGDNVPYLIGSLEKAIRSEVEIMQWVDRELTEYVKDHVVARELLKQSGEMSGDTAADKKAVDRKIAELRAIKDRWGDDVPSEQRQLKETYESLHVKIDGEIQKLGEGKRGRIASKGAIAWDTIKFMVSKEIVEGEPDLDRDPEGGAEYLMSRLADKLGPLRKDSIFIASYATNPVLEPPPHFTWKYHGVRELHGQRFHLYETWGVDNFMHPTFDGRITENSPLAKNLDQYRGEIFAVRDYLRTLETKYRDAGLPWLDVTSDQREGTDRYKNGRALMVAAVTLGMMDAIIDIYTAHMKVHTMRPPSEHDDSFSYLTDVTKDHILTDLVEHLGGNRNKMIIAALTYSNGGTLSRAHSETPRYPTRRLSPQNNQLRLNNERKSAVDSTSDYQELREQGIHDLLSLQSRPITEITVNHGTRLAMKTMILTAATRYINLTSYRAWKLPAQGLEAAVQTIRQEHPDLMQPDGTGYNDRYFELIDHALTQAVGLGKVPFAKP